MIGVIRRRLIPTVLLMLRYLLGRLLGIAFVIFAVSVIIFLLMHALPGGPFDEDKVPLSPEAKANYLRKYGLDKAKFK